MAADTSLATVTQKLVGAITDAATQIAEEVMNALCEVIEPIEIALNAYRQLTPEQEEIAASFSRLSAAELEDELAHYGVPRTASERGVHLALFGALVEAFEREWVWATASRSQRTAMSLADGGGLGFDAPTRTRDGIAAHNTRVAVEQRGREWDAAVDIAADAGLLDKTGDR